MAKKKKAAKKAAPGKPAAVSPGAGKFTHVVTLRTNQSYFDGRTKFVKDIPVNVDAKTAAALAAKEPKKFDIKSLAEVKAAKDSEAELKEAAGGGDAPTEEDEA